MKKSIVVTLLFLGLIFAFSLNGLQSPKPRFCQLGLALQIKAYDVAVLKTRVDKSISTSTKQSAGSCIYDVTVTKSLLEEYTGVPKLFKLEGAPWNRICEPTGNEIFVVLKKEFLTRDLKTCDYAAVVNPSKEAEIPRIIAQSHKEK